MRRSATNKAIAVRAIAGSHTVFLGFNARRTATRGLLGFAVRRTDHTEDEEHWLRGQLTFAETHHEAQHYSLLEHPIQDFKWIDASAKPGHSYSYRVVPVYGKPARLEPGRPVTVKISTEAEVDENGVHNVFFNRGAAASQAFEHRFGDPSPKELQTEGSPQLTWLSRGLEEAILQFIGDARSRSWAIRGSLYEFTHLPVLQALAAAAKRGADVRLVVDDMGAGGENCKPIRQAKLRKLVIPRDASGVPISHNKFLILLHRKKPVAVWTGSTNLTRGGIFGHSNVGHLVWDEHIAATYLEYWEHLSGNPPKSGSSGMAAFNNELVQLPRSLKSRTTMAVFSPRGANDDPDALEWYARLMDQAKSGVFLTAAFGVSNELTDVFRTRKTYLRYLLADNKGQRGNKQNMDKILRNHHNRVAMGDIIRPGVLAGWHAEHLTGFNTHVPYLHTKYMLIDPLSRDPVVISGSANFSKASTVSNDENMLVIRGNRRVADIYFTEFMRLFTHFYFRDRVDEAERKRERALRKRLRAQGKKWKGAEPPPRALHLKPSDSWAGKYYTNEVLRKERRHFGPAVG